jgi:hypothetical protein
LSGNHAWPHRIWISHPKDGVVEIEQPADWEDPDRTDLNALVALAPVKFAPSLKPKATEWQNHSIRGNYLVPPSLLVSFGVHGGKG